MRLVSPLFIKNENVVSRKGKKKVGKSTSCERRRNMTLMFAMSETGCFTSLFIFQSKKMDKEGRLII